MLNDAIFDGIVEAGYIICGAQRPFSVFVLIGPDLGIMRRNSGNEDTSCGRNTTGHDRELIDDAFLVNFMILRVWILVTLVMRGNTLASFCKNIFVFGCYFP